MISNDGGAPRTWMASHTHRSWLLGQAQRLFDFFRSSLGEDGRFVDLDDDGRPVQFRDASQSVPGQRLLTVARAVHCYSLGELLGVPGCASIVEHGLRALWDEHRDTKSGGYVQIVDATGPVDGTKSAYGHAFVLLAAASALTAGHDARGLYEDVRAVIDEHFWSEQDGAAREAFAGDWDELEPYRGANANMHLCEAFLAASDATGDEALAERAARIAQLLIDRQARAQGWLLPEHYDTAWQPILGYNRDRTDYDLFRPYGATIGHMLEWSRLLPSAWIATGKSDAWMPQAAVELFATAVRLGWDNEHGGLAFTVDWDGSPANPDHYWWPIAEGISASAFLLHLTAEPLYEEWYRRFWDFAGFHLIDYARGGWYPELGPTNRRKVGLWYGKPDLYHALQSCLLPLLTPAPSLAGALKDLPPVT